MCVCACALKSKHTLVVQETNDYRSHSLSLPFNYLCIIIIFSFQITNFLSLCGIISIIMACSEYIAYLKLLEYI